MHDATLTTKTIRRSETGSGYINLTELCQAAGKRIYDYLRLKSTPRFLTELALKVGLPDDHTLVKKITEGTYCGTWGHPVLAHAVAEWTKDDAVLAEVVRLNVLTTQEEEKRVEAAVNNGAELFGDLSDNELDVALLSSLGLPPLHLLYTVGSTVRVLRDYPGIVKGSAAVVIEGFKAEDGSVRILFDGSQKYVSATSLSYDHTPKLISGFDKVAIVSPEYQAAVGSEGRVVLSTSYHGAGLLVIRLEKTGELLSVWAADCVLRQDAPTIQEPDAPAEPGYEPGDIQTHRLPSTAPEVAPDDLPPATPKTADILDELKGRAKEEMRTQRYFNAAPFCKHRGCDSHAYLKNHLTKEFLPKLAQRLCVPVSGLSFRCFKNDDRRGTWLHEDLFGDFIQWLVSFRKRYGSGPAEQPAETEGTQVEAQASEQEKTPPAEETRTTLVTLDLSDPFMAFAHFSEHLMDSFGAAMERATKVAAQEKERADRAEAANKVLRATVAERDEQNCKLSEVLARFAPPALPEPAVEDAPQPDAIPEETDKAREEMRRELHILGKASERLQYASVTDFAKATRPVFGMGRDEMFDYLRDNKVLFRHADVDGRSQVMEEFADLAFGDWVKVRGKDGKPQEKERWGVFLRTKRGKNLFGKRLADGVEWLLDMMENDEGLAFYRMLAADRRDGRGKRWSRLAGCRFIETKQPSAPYEGLRPELYPDPACEKTEWNGTDIVMYRDYGKDAECPRFKLVRRDGLGGYYHAWGTTMREAVEELRSKTLKAYVLHKGRSLTPDAS